MSIKNKISCYIFYTFNIDFFNHFFITYIYIFLLGFLTSTAENLFKTLLGMLTRTVSDATVGEISREEKMKGLIEDLLDKLPEEFNMLELYGKVSLLYT